MEQTVERNPYADHLVEVNKYNPVMTTQSICNSQGAIVIPEGTYITEDVANKIARFKLNLPIELQVNLATSLSPHQLFNDIQLAQKNILGEYLQPSISKELVRQCGLISVYPLLSQKLTVFADRLPQKYASTQSATGLAILLALQLGLDDESIEVVFATTQMHDAGFLNIDPDMAKVMDLLPDEERRTLYKQQLSLGKEFLDQIPNLSNRVGRAVLEYKERKDGSGWPQGMIGDRCSIESQVVGLAVMLNDAYTTKLKPRGYGTHNLLPFAQIEIEGLDRGVYNAAVEVLRKNAHGIAQALPFEFMPPLAKYLAVIQRMFIHWLILAKECAAQMEQEQDILETKRPVLIISGLEELYRNSGLWDGEIRSWLLGVANNGLAEDMTEVEVIALMFESVLSKLKRLQWSMREAAKQLGSGWIVRCDELATLIYNLPKDHFEALEKYKCFEE